MTALKLSHEVLARRVYREDVNMGLAANTIMKFVVPLLDPLKVALDVGAATGHITNIIAPHVFRVYGFEAVLPVFFQYCKMQDRWDNVVPVYGAVGSDMGTAEFFVDDKRLSNSGFQDLVDGQKTRVPMLCLDPMFDQDETIGFVKVDVEGNELDVLRGAEGILRRDRPLLMVEIYKPFCPYPLEKVFQWIMDQGYTCFWYVKSRGHMASCHTAEEAAVVCVDKHEEHDGDFLFAPTQLRLAEAWKGL